MPKYQVSVINDESGMLFAKKTVYAADAESAKKSVEDDVKEEAGYTNANNQAAVPRFRTSATEVTV